MADRFFPDFEFDPDRSFLHIQDGNARFNALRTLTLDVDDYIQSSNYDGTGAGDGTVGWHIDGDGKAEFQDVVARGEIVATSGSISGNLDVSGSLSGNYTLGSAGWKVNGDGTAEFNDVTVRGVLETDLEAFGGVTSRILIDGATVEFQRSGATDGYLFDYFGNGVAMSTRTDTGTGASVAVDHPDVRISSSDAVTGHIYMDSVFGNVEVDGNAVSLQPAYNNTTASAANVHVDAGGWMKRSTSSARYKHDIEPYAPDRSVLGLSPSLFRGNSEPGRRLLGLIAEDVAEVLPVAAIMDGEGRPDAIDWNALVTALLSEVQGLAAQVDALAARVQAVEQS